MSKSTHLMTWVTRLVDIDSAVASGNPDALFQAGTILSNGYGIDALQGFALSIAACDLGYDCSAETNPTYSGFAWPQANVRPALALRMSLPNR
jgi:hypothetical protein